MSSLGVAETPTTTMAAAGVLHSPQLPPPPHQQRRWIKYYCEECAAWETREMFQVVQFDRRNSSNPKPPPSPCTVWSWACAQLLRHGTFQSFRVAHLNSADGHDLEAPHQLDFPTTTTTSSPSSSPTPLPAEGEEEAAAEGRAPEQLPAVEATAAAMDPAMSNGSSQQSKRPKRNVRSTYARDHSPVNSQGGVTSSSPTDEGMNGASTGHAAAAATAATTAGDAAGPESPAVIDADAEHHENGVHKRPRRLTAGDRGLAQALQYERPRKATTPKPVADVKPSAPALAAAMKRPKRVTAGLKGRVIAAENAKFAPRVSVKKETKKVAVHQVSVQTRSASATKPSKKNKKLGDLY